MLPPAHSGLHEMIGNIKKGTYNLPKIFDWKQLKQKSVQVISAQFIFKYDSEKHKFKITNDA